MYGSELVLFGKGGGGKGCISNVRRVDPFCRADDASQENEEGPLQGMCT